MTDSEKTELKRVAGLVADGEPVDWAALERSGELGAEELKALRLLQEVACVHRPPVGDVRAADLPRGFEVKGELGSGATGHVWRAFDRALSREVALKVVKPDAAASGRARARFLEEARVLASLRHPNIVQVFSIDADEGADGAIRLVLELVEGRTLTELVGNEGPLDAREAARVGVELCRALAALHARGIVHRDLKPSNVMRERGGRIVLLDFGLARSPAAHRQLSSASAGTPRFMAPEQFEARGETGPAADLWALGALLYWLVAEHHAFAGRDFAELERNVLAGALVPLVDRCPDVPADFAQVVARALEREPARRFRSAGEMEAALRACLDAPTPGAVSGKRPRGSGWPLWALAALLVALFAWQAWPSRRLDVELDLYARRGGQDVRLLSGAATRVGDLLVLEVRPEQECHVYVIDEDDHGDVHVLFPAPGFDLANPLAAGRTHRLPGVWEGKPQFWEVTSSGGAENILVVASREPLEQLEQVLSTLPAVTPGAGPVYPAVTPQQRQLVLRGIGGTQPEAPTGLSAATSHTKFVDSLIPMLEREGSASIVVRSCRLLHAP